jgi:hypothetical protein
VLSLWVLALQAMPLTWRRIVLIAAMTVGFALLFPLAVVRRFYELELPHGYIGLTLLVAAIGAGALTAFWLFIRRRSHEQSEVTGG